MRSIVCSILVLITTTVVSQPLRELYEETLALGDKELQAKVLDGWEEMRPQDPDLCLARAEHFIRKATRKRTNPDSIAFASVRASIEGDTSSRTRPYYQQIAFQYDRALLAKAFDYLTRGIEANPDHIILRATKINLLEVIDSSAMASEMLSLLERAKVNGNTWLMHDSVPWNSYDTLSLYLQRKVRYMFARKVTIPHYLRIIAQSILELYPNHHQSLVDIGRSYYLDKEYTKAMEYFYRAEKIMPHSLEALGYIALCSYYTGDRANAIKYFDKLKIHGDEADRRFADDLIEELTR